MSFCSGSHAKDTKAFYRQIAELCFVSKLWVLKGSLSLWLTIIHYNIDIWICVRAL